MGIGILGTLPEHPWGPVCEAGPTHSLVELGFVLSANTGQVSDSLGTVTEGLGWKEIWDTFVTAGIHGEEDRQLLPNDMCKGPGTTAPKRPALKTVFGDRI